MARSSDRCGRTWLSRVDSLSERGVGLSWGFHTRPGGTLDGDEWEGSDDWADDADSYDYIAPPGYIDVAPFSTLTQDDESTAPITLAVSVTNGAGTVTATATISGWLQRIELEPQVASMDETQLAREIVATAALASLKGRASQRSLIEDMLTHQGADSHIARDYVDEYMNLPTPAQAAEAEAEANARYLRGEY